MSNALDKANQNNLSFRMRTYIISEECVIEAKSFVVFGDWQGKI